MRRCLRQSGDPPALGNRPASALAAAGVPYLARSFKYHRPRSILSFANHDSNTLFQVDGVINSLQRVCFAMNETSR